MKDKNEVVSPTTCHCGEFLHYRIIKDGKIVFHEYFCPKNCGKYQPYRILIKERRKVS